MRTNFAISVMFLMLSTLLFAQNKPKIIRTIHSEGMKIAVEQIADGLGIPWGFDFLPDGSMIITDRAGKMNRLNLKDFKRQELKGVPQVHAKGQGGLFDVHRHPDFAKNQIIYFTYAAPVPGGSTTRLAQAKLVGDELKDVQVLFSAEKSTSKNIHYGARILIDQSGFIFLSIGDRGERERAQDLSDHGGKVLRLHLDGSAPKDNPFVATKNAKPEIWTYGHRNPQGLAIHPRTQEIFEQEHGPRGGDEINVLKKGANYGWPEVTFGHEYWGPKIGVTEKEGMENPVHQWTPSIAPSGLAFYAGDIFPQWRGNIFSGAMVLTHVNRLVLDGAKLVKEERLLNDWGQRIRNIKTGPDGLLYFSNDQGQLLRFKSPK